MRKVTDERNVTLVYKLIQIVGYAGDICIMGRMNEAMKQTYKEPRRVAKEVGLSFIVNKAIIMVHSRCDTYTGKEMKTGDMIEVVDEFLYLGTCITKHRDELEDMRRRTGLANNVYSH